LEILLVRHGENLANLTKEFSHKKVDYDLTEKGVLQAMQTAHFLKSVKIDRIVSSPLKRATQTAKFISESIEIEIEIDERFREINVGALEDRKPTEESWRTYTTIVSDWYRGKLESRFPEGESGNELRSRFRNAIVQLTEKEDERVLIVGHAGIFINGIIELCRLTKPIEFYSDNFHNCSISTIKVDKSLDRIDFHIKSWGKVEHLNGKAAEFENWK